MEKCVFCPPIIHSSSLIPHGGLLAVGSLRPNKLIHKFIICQAFFIIVLGFRPFESSSWNLGLHQFRVTSKDQVQVEWSRAATTLMQATMGCVIKLMHEEAYQTKKHIKITLKKYVLVQLHDIHWTSSPFDAFLQFQFSLICQLGLVGSAFLCGKFPTSFQSQKVEWEQFLSLKFHLFYYFFLF